MSTKVAMIEALKRWGLGRGQMSGLGEIKTGSGQKPQELTVFVAQ